jgi:penicillin amidase
MGKAKSLKEFIAALEMVQVPGICICYADAEGNILMRPTGSYPVRAKGAGRIPMEGATGEHDWKERIPQSQMPMSVNPNSHFLASANNVPTAPNFPLYLGWMWDASYRKRRINALLSPAEKLDVASISKVQLDAHDLAAERFVPVLVQALRERPSSDATVQEALRILQAWNFDCTPDSVAPSIWVKWFPLYRDAVWKDEWQSRGIQLPEGSWGFSGTNRREPELEVLEQLTREQPDSVWFDDRTTPEKEDRNAILVRSFLSAVEQLKKERGADVAKWRWGDVNYLKLDSLFGQSLLSRKGAPVTGSPFTVNPGGGGGGVTSGASWRMIVDFGKPADSIGVYPGGQTENPLSPHYADLMPLWQKGNYAPLQALAPAETVAGGAGAKKTTFVPAKAAGR